MMEKVGIWLSFEPNGKTVTMASVGSSDAPNWAHRIYGSPSLVVFGAWRYGGNFRLVYGETS